ncbi:MAG TPA: hypothetical protein VLA19_06750, partial [Herpetosiphonaceae bacterium]|nr:hypothetical protein [Herpetosiphonaceae bacterium]
NGVGGPAVGPAVLGAVYRDPIGTRNLYTAVYQLTSNQLLPVTLPTCTTAMEYLIGRPTFDPLTLQVSARP